MSTGSTVAAERITRALSALRFDIWIVVLSAAFVISEAAPGRGAKVGTQSSAIGDASSSYLARQRSLVALPRTHDRSELFTIHDEHHGYVPWAEYQAEGDVR